MPVFLKKNPRLSFLLFAFLVVIPILLFAFSQKSNPLPQRHRATFSPTPTYITSEERLLNKFTNRQPLSTPDQTVKDKILVYTKGESDAVLYQTANVRIDYVKTPDLFQAEIQTVDIDLAKNEAMQWFQSQGMSQKGICDLPLQFYLEFNILQEVKDKNIPFTPLAPGC